MPSNENKVNCRSITRCGFVRKSFPRRKSILSKRVAKYRADRGVFDFFFLFLTTGRYDEWEYKILRVNNYNHLNLIHNFCTTRSRDYRSNSHVVDSKWTLPFVTMKTWNPFIYEKRCKSAIGRHDIIISPFPPWTRCRKRVRRNA